MLDTCVSTNIVFASIASGNDNLLTNISGYSFFTVITEIWGATDF